MDTLVKAALDKVNESVGKIFTLKESDYPSPADFKEMALLDKQERREAMSKWASCIPYEVALEDLTIKAENAIEALKAAIMACELKLG